MRFLPRLVAFVALIAVILLLLGEVRRAQTAAVEDHTRVIVLFAGILFLAVLAGGIAAWTFLPTLGDKIGEMIYGSAESNENDPLVRGHAEMAAGNYERALKWFRAALKATPDDTAAMGEIVDLQCRYLGQVSEALALLDEALGMNWPVDELSFLRCKQAEVYGRYLGDHATAREILQQTIADAPATLYAHNAHSLLTEFAETEEG